MAPPLRAQFTAPLLVLVLLLVALAIGGTDDAAAAKPRTGIGAAREAKKLLGCARNLSSLRLKHLPPHQRRRIRHKRIRLMRRLPRCRAAAAGSVAGPEQPLYWGAWISKQLTGGEAPWDMGAVDAFEGMAGKKLSVIEFASPFADCSHSPCSFYDFPTNPMEGIRKRGAIPLLGWTSQSTPSSLNQPDFQLSDVISGRHDSYIRGFAEAARDWGHPFFLRFNWEMNGNWFSWSERTNGNRTGEYIAAWRHVHDIFTEVGAHNATWVWCPNIDPHGEMQTLTSLYPGDAYVDWTGLDGYNWGTHPTRRDKWRSFDELFRSTYDLITDSIAPSKPMIVSEVGSSEIGGSKGAWIEDMLTTVPRSYPKIRGLVWFEKFDDNMDWPIETSSGSVAGFASGIRNPNYLESSFSRLGPGKVPPPS